MGKRTAIVFGLVALAVVSIGLISWPEFVARYQAYRVRQSDFLSQVASSGDYQLFSKTEVNPLVTIHLEKGEAIGFKSGARGMIAVAGRCEYPIQSDKRTYFWKRK